MITYEQAKEQADYTDEDGNLYRTINGVAFEFCVDYYDRRRNNWVQDMGKDFSHLIPLKKAFTAIQCKAPCGKLGCFMFTHKDANGYHVISPVFPDYASLCMYAKANGWYWKGGLNGYYAKD